MILSKSMKPLSRGELMDWFSDADELTISCHGGAVNNIFPLKLHRVSLHWGQKLCIYGASGGSCMVIQAKPLYVEFAAASMTIRLPDQVGGVTIFKTAKSLRGKRKRFRGRVAKQCPAARPGE